MIKINIKAIKIVKEKYYNYWSTIEKHLNWDVKISKNWVYITHTISFEKAIMWVNLLIALIWYEDIEQHFKK